MNTKEILKSLIPPLLISLIKPHKKKYGFSGNYSSWQEAKKHTIGYDSDLIVEKVKDSLLKVKSGEALYERDSVLFDKIEYSWPLLTGLLYIASKKEGKLKVLDFGGSLGSSYFQNRNFLDGLNYISWNIVEQKKFVEYGKKYFQDEILKFYYDLDECIKNEKPDIILLSSVIQYIEKPYELLDKILSFNIEYIIFDRTTFIKEGNDIITIQKVSPDIYNASYPAWFFNFDKFIHFLSTKYTLVSDFNALAGIINLEKTIAEDKGLILKIKNYEYN